MSEYPVAVLFIQGAGEGAHDADGALAEELGQALGAGFLVGFPRLPNEADPDSGAWKRAIVAEARRADARVVVAHSAGAAILADLLAEGRFGAELPGVRGLFLLAPPFVGPGGWRLDGFHFDRPPSPASLAGLPIHFYFGSSDTTVPPTHADLYERVFPGARFSRLPGCDHQFAACVSRVAEDVRALVEASGA